MVKVLTIESNARNQNTFGCMNIAIDQKILSALSFKTFQVVVVVNIKWPHQNFCFYLILYKNNCDKPIDSRCLDEAIAHF